MYHLEDVFGIDSSQLQAQTIASPEAPTPTSFAGHAQGGQPGLVAAFTDWRRSPMFWVALFAVIALGYIHLEGSVRVALQR